MTTSIAASMATSLSASSSWRSGVRRSTMMLPNAFTRTCLDCFHGTIARSAHAHASGEGHSRDNHSSNKKKGYSSSTISRFVAITSLLALGPAYHLLPLKREESHDLGEKQASTPSPVKTKIPSRPSGRADRPRPIKNVPYVQYVLIGGGTSSYSAMEAIREAQPDAQILIISEEEFVPYQRPPLSKELWFSGRTTDSLSFKDWEGNQRSLFYLPKESYRTLSVDQIDTLDETSTKIHFLANAKVTKLNPEEQTVVLSNGARIQYSRVLIATGGTPKTLPVFDSAFARMDSRIMTFRGIQDFQRLESISNGNKTIVVVGGGFLGSELAVALAAGSDVKIIQTFPEDGNMGLVFPRYLTKWTTAKLREVGVDVKPNTEIVKVEANQDNMVLQYNNGDSVKADFVVLAVGLSPNQELAYSSGLEVDSIRGGIVVNAELEARTNVFAAGDVTSYHDIALGRRRVEHYDHAVMSGRMAGFNMAGSKKPYTHQSMFWSDLGPNVGYEAAGIIDSKMRTMGVWAKSDKNTNIIPGNDEFGKGVVFYLSPEKKVLGVLTWNVFGKMDLARKIIREGKPHTDMDGLARGFDIYSK
ncbi:hypothetical protein BSLG_007347 [Batrachochytrium salamandrivorans]|nr:hypothetical protein BSLG_007347 [Batrachochytrium salamandrivorans]